MELCLLNLLILIFLCVLFLPLVCSYRACNVINQESHVYSWHLGKIYFVYFLKFWNLPRFIREISKFRKSKLGKCIPNFPLKHVITNTTFFEVSMMLSLQCSCLFSDVVWEDKRIGGETRHLARWNETKGNTCRRKRATFTSGTSLWMFLSFSLQDIVYGI